MNRMSAAWIALIAVATCCGAQELQLTSLLPAPLADKGWRFDLEPQSYSPDNLFEYIDGEAELYNDYHFVGMVTAAYIKGSDMALSYTVDISELASPLDAFGLYSRHRTPELSFAAIGEEATLSELNLRFYQNRYFVQINAGSFEGEVQDEMLRVARAIVASLPPAAPAHELQLLPQAEQQPHSLQYFTRGMLGQSAFPAGLMARYLVAGDTLQAFLVLTAETRQSLAAFSAFTANLKERGRLIAELPGRI
ncbi:MAG TPA: hypothetical protein PLG50_12495, partial [bacterium]|nr:hypothetical protein [bacterium]